MAKEVLTNPSEEVIRLLKVAKEDIQKSPFLSIYQINLAGAIAASYGLPVPKKELSELGKLAYGHMVGKYIKDINFDLAEEHLDFERAGETLNLAIRSSIRARSHLKWSGLLSRLRKEIENKEYIPKKEQPVYYGIGK